MASWGVELELHGISITLYITEVVIRTSSALVDRIHFNPPIQIGPTKQLEREGLKNLMTGVARNLRPKLCPQDPLLDDVIETWIAREQTSNALFQSLYAFEAQFDESLLPAELQAHESALRGEFAFSADHGGEIVIPELITEPFGRKPGDRTLETLNPEEAVAFLQNAYRYAIATYRHLPLIRNINFQLYSIEKLVQEIFKICTDDKPPRQEHFAILKGTMHLQSVSPTPALHNKTHSFIASQLNTIIDLTHFADRPQDSPMPDPLQNLLRLSDPQLPSWLPNFSKIPHSVANYEINILMFTRAVVAQMHSRIDPGISNFPSSPWIRGAIGFGIWATISLSIGSSESQSSNKNLWLLMPKTNVIYFLQAAFTASQTLSNHDYYRNYYLCLLNNFIDAFDFVDNGIAHDSPLRLALNNASSFSINGMNLIFRRLKKWLRHTPISSFDHMCAPNSTITIKRFIVATLSAGIHEDGRPAFNLHELLKPQLSRLFDNDEDLFNDTRRLLWKCHNAYQKIDVRARGGYGRPKFEHRGLPNSIVLPGHPSQEPNYVQYIEILNTVASPAPGYVVLLPSDIPPQYMSIADDLRSVDSVREDSLYGGTRPRDYGQKDAKEYLSVWIPNTEFEHGRRASKYVRQWIDAQSLPHTQAPVIPNRLTEIQIKYILEKTEENLLQQKELIEQQKKMLQEIVTKDSQHQFDIQDAQIKRFSNFANKIHENISDLHSAIGNSFSMIRASTENFHVASAQDILNKMFKCVCESTHILSASETIKNQITAQVTEILHQRRTRS